MFQQYKQLFNAQSNSLLTVWIMNQATPRVANLDHDDISKFREIKINGILVIIWFQWLKRIAQTRILLDPYSRTSKKLKITEIK